MARHPRNFYALLLLVAGLFLVAASAQAQEAKFVGSASCAQCHKAEHKDWLGSHHAVAMQAANDQTVLGRFDGATFEQRRGEEHFLQEGRKIPGPHRRPGRQAGRFRHRLYLRRRAFAAISDRLAERPPAGFGNRLGRAAGGRGRPALVSSLSRSEAWPRRSAALDRHRPKLELPVRLVPLDQPAKEP